MHREASEIHRRVIRSLCLVDVTDATASRTSARSSILGSLPISRTEIVTQPPQQRWSTTRIPRSCAFAGVCCKVDRREGGVEVE